MMKKEALLFDKLGRLVALTRVLTEHGGRFDHASAEREYQELLKEPSRESDSEVGLELAAMHRAVAAVLASKKVNASVLSQLHAARDHAALVMIKDEYQPHRAPMKSGFTE